MLSSSNALLHDIIDCMGLLVRREIALDTMIGVDGQASQKHDAFLP